MNGSSHQFLPGSRLPEDQDRHIGGRHLIDEFENLHERFAAPDDVSVLPFPTQLLPEADVFVFQPLGPVDLLDVASEALEVDGLGHVIVSAVSKGFHRRLDGSVRRDNDHLGLWPLFLDVS